MQYTTVATMQRISKLAKPNIQLHPRLLYSDNLAKQFILYFFYFFIIKNTITIIITKKQYRDKLKLIPVLIISKLTINYELSYQLTNLLL